MSGATDIRTLRFAGRELVLGQRTLVMGILNMTPDSFSDGGDYMDLDTAVAQARKMLAEGADIIDIGGESSRPGHTRITADEELRRVLPVIRRLASETDAVLSLDTIRAEGCRGGRKKRRPHPQRHLGLPGGPAPQWRRG